MGNCASEPAVHGDEDPLRADGHDAPQRTHTTSGQSSAATLRRASSLFYRTSHAIQQDIMDKVNSMQQTLLAVSPSPLLALSEAAELLAGQLECDLVGVWVVPRDDPSGAVFMAGHGTGMSVLQRSCAVQRVAEGGPARAGAPCGWRVPDAAAPGGGVTPSELWLGPPGLRSFVQVPIGPPNAPLGVLMLATSKLCSFDSAGWQVKLQFAANGLLPHVRHAQVDRVARLLRAMGEEEDTFALIATLLQGASDFVLRTCKVDASARLALLRPPPPGAAAPREALLFEAPRARPMLCSGGGGGGSWARDALRPVLGSSTQVNCIDGVVASPLKVPNTLLGAALAQGQARFVADVRMYMQSCARPARDVFTASSHLVSAVVVVPLIVDGEPPLGGLYIVPSAPCQFGNIQDALLGFIHAVTPALYMKLSGRAESLAAVVSAVGRRTSISYPSRAASDAAASGSPDGLMELVGGSGATNSCASDHAMPCSSLTAAGGAALGQGPGSVCMSSAGGGLVGPTPSGLLPTVKSSQRLNTDAMLQLLERDIMAKDRRRRSMEEPRARSFNPEVTVNGVIGRSAGATVFRGVWHRAPAALKVMPSRHDEAEAMRDTLEMAVLSSVAHPNVVQVYACLTNMVEAQEFGGGRSSGRLSGELRSCYRRLRPDEDDCGRETFNILVMEPCDRGTLRGAVGSGLLHATLPGGGLGVAMSPLLEVLCDVAGALRHLHGMGLVHGDMKMENVLMKTDPVRPLGVTPKLSDFGLSRILSDAPDGDSDDADDGPAAPHAAAPHIAPEIMRNGGHATPAVDAYAFGILMWEAYTGRRAFAGVAPSDLPERVATQGLRPRFAAAAPPAYTRLAAACWAPEPAARPGFAKIAAELEKIADGLSAGAGI
ncbi:MAG: kinase-like domain-containing protein [Monoraphidium minutum]|nr:MAG: kinase-like domain-containing protein [Monoraphidium minutum]